uniref:Uncharacterized protein n=1 Tax=Molossus molossus TaxID=27622 RepID=A0A7J8J081_MOLMO|nr:hypothetical protein HJG59_010282 [Molossus molossus]
MCPLPKVKSSVTIYDPLYPLLPPDPLFSGNHCTVICVYEFLFAFLVCSFMVFIFSHIGKVKNPMISFICGIQNVLYFYKTYLQLTHLHLSPKFIATIILFSSSIFLSFWYYYISGITHNLLAFYPLSFSLFPRCFIQALYLLIVHPSYY